jgi:topoisomerase-4 subunit A
VHAFVLDTETHYLLANSGGYGFLCPGTELVTSKKAGKAVMTLEDGEAILAPTAVKALNEGGEIVVGASSGKVLVFGLAELKQMAKGRGMQLMSLGGKDKVTAATAYERPVTELVVATTPSARKKLTQVTLAGKDLDAHRAKRARAGAALPDKAVALATQATLGEAIAPVANDPTPATDAPPEQPMVPPAGSESVPFDFGDSDVI